MKTLRKVVMLLAVLVLCLPAEGDILVYSKTIKCWDAQKEDSGGWNIIDKTIRGFLILDITFDKDGVIDKIGNAVQVEYTNNNVDDKIYTVTEHEFNIVRIVNIDSVESVLVKSDSDESGNQLTMLRGTAGDTDIGFGKDVPREVAKRLEGNLLTYWAGEAGDILQMCDYSLRLQRSWTKWFNWEEMDIDGALENIKAWLEWKGYLEER